MVVWEEKRGTCEGPSDKLRNLYFVLSTLKGYYLYFRKMILDEMIRIDHVRYREGLRL